MASKELILSGAKRNSLLIGILGAISAMIMAAYTCGGGLLSADRKVQAAASAKEVSTIKVDMARVKVQIEALQAGQKRIERKLDRVLEKRP